MPATFRARPTCLPLQEAQKSPFRYCILRCGSGDMTIFAPNVVDSGVKLGHLGMPIDSLTAWSGVVWAITI